MKKKIIVTAVCFVVGSLVAILLWGNFVFQINTTPALAAIEQGDYSSVSNDSIVETLEIIMNRRGLQDVEWIYFDLNDDGQNELILQEKASVAHTGIKRIIGIFAEQHGQVSVILWDANDMGEYSFLLNNRLIYFDQYYGTYGYESYQIYEYDHHWDKRLAEGYEYYNIDSMESLPPDWLDTHPALSQEGTYFQKYTVEDMDGKSVRVYQELTMQQWLDELGFNITKVFSRRIQTSPGTRISKVNRDSRTVGMNDNPLVSFTCVFVIRGIPLCRLPIEKGKVRKSCLSPKPLHEKEKVQLPTPTTQRT